MHIKEYRAPRESMDSSWEADKKIDEYIAQHLDPLFVEQLHFTKLPNFRSPIYVGDADIVYTVRHVEYGAAANPAIFGLLVISTIEESALVTTIEQELRLMQAQ